MCLCVCHFSLFFSLNFFSGKKFCLFVDLFAQIRNIFFQNFHVKYMFVFNRSVFSVDSNFAVCSNLFRETKYFDFSHPESIMDSTFGKSFLFLTKLAWNCKVTLPVLVTAVFLAMDFRMQIELNIETEQMVFQVSTDTAHLSSSIQICMLKSIIFSVSFL